uniref:Chemokine (C-X-C motif) ligand 8b, duplicate 3 n=1 Tax=Cyprinus carpio carpio TaxID=630221 RepID=A0A8C1DGH3_CYPCA
MCICINFHNEEVHHISLCSSDLHDAAVHNRRPPIQQLRCQCVKTYSGKPINPKLIQKVQMISAGPQCRNVEIIATLKNGLTCLNPTDEWFVVVVFQQSSEKVIFPLH